MNRISKHDEQSSDMYVTQDGEIGGKVPEELYGLASKETIVDYVKGMVLVALLLWGASYMKQQAQQKAQKHLQELPAEQRAKLEQARETYGGPGM
jgi:hypothetical protein